VKVSKRRSAPQAARRFRCVGGQAAAFFRGGAGDISPRASSFLAIQVVTSLESQREALPSFTGLGAAMCRYGLQARKGSGRKPRSTKRISLAKVKWVKEE
jgi:hypothetical protein